MCAAPGYRNTIPRCSIVGVAGVAAISDLPSGLVYVTHSNSPKVSMSPTSNVSLPLSLAYPRCDRSPHQASDTEVPLEDSLTSISICSLVHPCRNVSSSSDPLFRVLVLIVCNIIFFARFFFIPVIPPIVVRRL